MKTVFALVAAVGLFMGSTLYAAEALAKSTEELEAKFKATMNGATMAGHSSGLKSGVLGTEKDDKYSIVSVEKVSGSSWVINARLRGAVVPIPVEVRWAGDVAVIIVDNLQIPGANYTSAYSARVMVHEHTYAGTWSGGDHGGLLSGIITNDASAGAASK